MNNPELDGEMEEEVAEKNHTSHQQVELQGDDNRSDNDLYWLKCIFEPVRYSSKTTSYIYGVLGRH